MHEHQRLYIGGEWIEPFGAATLAVTNPATEETLGTVPRGGPEDVDVAVEAARSGFETWSRAPVAHRIDTLQRLADGLRERQHALAEAISLEVGMPIGKSLAIQSRLPVTVTQSYADLLTHFPFEEEVGNSTLWREPIGVVGCITPWNFPLHQIIAKVAPALAAGCAVVVKPSEIAPFNAFMLAEIIDDLDMPAGVFNLVSGTGTQAGESLVRHPDVDMISFTGSLAVGRRIGRLASDTVKRVTLELGGKSANIILDDADLARAVRSGVNHCFLNSGQTCDAWTRMLVPRDLHDGVVELAKTTAETFDLGDPMTSGTKLGPLVSSVQRERVRSFITQGLDEGATLVTGGPEAPPELPRGYFVRPTVFADVHRDMVIAQEEIFGPVLAILPYETEDEAVDIANDTIFGLGGAVWSHDLERARRVARRLRCGQVFINGASFNPLAPFGGYKQSGNGREMGRAGLEEYLEIKAVQH